MSKVNAVGKHHETSFTYHSPIHHFPTGFIHSFIHSLWSI